MRPRSCSRLGEDRRARNAVEGADAAVRQHLEGEEQEVRVRAGHIVKIRSLVAPLGEVTYDCYIARLFCGPYERG